jgi:hypothetical protein
LENTLVDPRFHCAFSYKLTAVGGRAAAWKKGLDRTGNLEGDPGAARTSLTVRVMPFKRFTLSKLGKAEPKPTSDPEESKALKGGGVLEKYWLTYVGFAWFQFIAFEMGLTLDKHHSKNPLCPYSDRDYPIWFWYIVVACLGGFIMICLAQLGDSHFNPHQYINLFS